MGFGSGNVAGPARQMAKRHGAIPRSYGAFMSERYLTPLDPEKEKSDFLKISCLLGLPTRKRSRFGGGFRDGVASQRGSRVAESLTDASLPPRGGRVVHPPRDVTLRVSRCDRHLHSWRWHTSTHRPTGNSRTVSGVPSVRTSPTSVVASRPGARSAATQPHHEVFPINLSASGGLRRFSLQGLLPPPPKSLAPRDQHGARGP